MSSAASRCYAMILAGGVGERVGADVPKQFIEVAGRPILAHTLKRFQEHPDMDEIEVVCIASHMDEMRRLRESFGLRPIVTLEIIFDLCCVQNLLIAVVSVSINVPLFPLHLSNLKAMG